MIIPIFQSFYLLQLSIVPLVQYPNSFLSTYNNTYCDYSNIHFPNLCSPHLLSQICIHLLKLPSTRAVFSRDGETRHIRGKIVCQAEKPGVFRDFVCRAIFTGRQSKFAISPETAVAAGGCERNKRLVEARPNVPRKRRERKKLSAVAGK